MAVSVFEIDDEVLVHVTDRLDGSNAPLVHEAVQHAVATGIVRVVIDLSAAYAVDDGGVAVLAATTVALRSRGGVCHVRLPYERVVELIDPALVRSALEP